VEGAEAEVWPLWCGQADILAVSRVEGRPSSEMVIGEGVRPTAVVRCEGVGSSSGGRCGVRLHYTPHKNIINH